MVCCSRAYIGKLFENYTVATERKPSRVQQCVQSEIVVHLTYCGRKVKKLFIFRVFCLENLFENYTGTGTVVTKRKPSFRFCSLYPFILIIVTVNVCGSLWVNELNRLKSPLQSVRKEETINPTIGVMLESWSTTAIVSRRGLPSWEGAATRAT